MSDTTSTKKGVTYNLSGIPWNRQPGLCGWAPEHGSLGERQGDEQWNWTLPPGVCAQPASFEFDSLHNSGPYYLCDKHAEVVRTTWQMEHVRNRELRPYLS